MLHITCALTFNHIVDFNSSRTQLEPAGTTEKCMLNKGTLGLNVMHTNYLITIL